MREVVFSRTLFPRTAKKIAPVDDTTIAGVILLPTPKVVVATTEEALMVIVCLRKSEGCCLGILVSTYGRVHADTLTQANGGAK